MGQNIVYVIEILGLDNLDHLTLNQNQLDHLGKGFFTGLPRLTTLYIDSNKIKSIHHEAFTGLEGKSFFKKLFQVFKEKNAYD